MDKLEYINISKASDIKNTKERRLYRFFEIIPGAISLLTLLGVIVFSWIIPSWVAIFVICFCFFYFFRIIYFSIHQLVSYFRIKSNMKKDWLKNLRSLKASEKDWKNIFHIAILPTYKESREIIEENIESIANANYPKEKIIVVLAIEQRAGIFFEQQAKEICKKYSEKFFKFLISVHPDKIEGEVAGKGSNTAYAGKIVKEEIINKLNIPYKNILISSFDIDTKIFPNYFSCLTYSYLTEKNPENSSYQPIPVYNNNIWQASLFSRVVSTSNTFWQMIQQERSEKLTTYSSHSMPAKVFFEVGYPQNIVSDDSRIFWKAYLYYDGNYKTVPLYYLISMDTVMSGNFLKTALNQYKQQKRWAWGCNEIPFLLFGFLQNKKISLYHKVSHIFTILDGFWSWAIAALLLFILGWLPLLLGGENFNFSVLSFNLPILTSKIMTFSMAGMFISAILSTLLLPPAPKNMKRYIKFLKKATVFLQWLLLPATLIIFGSFPALDAQIRLMLGKYIGFWVTEKVRK
jgi:cellulose synthase/poly-beta-1,6-N-acetylglucosamine synthase-like glycosyltransferase